VEENIKKAIKSLALFVFALILSLNLTSNAFAFVLVYGDGSADKPYRISTCSQLDSWINGGPGTTLNYINFLITNNLDCTGHTFNNTTILLHSTIDGGNHRIINLKFGGTSGLIYALDNSTIKNLWLATGDNDGMGSNVSGTFANQMINSSLENVRSSLKLTCDNYCGGLVGRAQDSTITNSVYDGILIAGHSSGGLVGSDIFYKTSNLNIKKSAFLGNMTAQQNSGGILGVLAENVSIEDSYVDGFLSLGPFSGGLIGGYNDVITISKSYTKFTGNLDIYSGGLIGGYNSNVIVSHSYSASPSIDYLVGSIEGDSNTNVLYSDVHYIDSVGYCKSNSNSVVAGCSSAGLYIPDSLILSMGFDLTDTWKKEIGKDPILKLTDFNDPTGIPNSGDMNDDSVKDTFQGNVEVLKNSSGYWTAIETKDTNTCNLGEANILDITGIPTYSGYDFTSDFVGFNVYCIDSNQSFTTNIYLDRNFDTSKAKLLSYNPTSKTFTLVNNASFTHKIIGSQIFTVLSYTLTDGGPYDRDGISNGKIVDPVVLVTPKGANTVISKKYIPDGWSYANAGVVSVVNASSQSNTQNDNPINNQPKNQQTDKKVESNDNTSYITVLSIVAVIVLGILINKFRAKK